MNNASIKGAKCLLPINQLPRCMFYFRAYHTLSAYVPSKQLGCILDSFFYDSCLRSVLSVSQAAANPAPRPVAQRPRLLWEQSHITPRPSRARVHTERFLQG